MSQKENLEIQEKDLDSGESLLSKLALEAELADCSPAQITPKSSQH